MQERPFIRLKNNVDKLNFECDERYLQIYQNAFKNVLDRVDAFLLNNDLYSSINYDDYVDALLSHEEELKFNNFDELRGGEFYAMYTQQDFDKREITVATEFLTEGVNLEAIICHEFIHDLTVGRSEVKYEKNGNKYEFLRSMDTLFITDKGKSSANQMVQPHAIIEKSQEFICEGYTELLTQTIYPDTTYMSYKPQIRLIKFCNEIMGEADNIQGFLQGFIPKFDDIMSAKQYKEFSKTCDLYQNEGFLRDEIDFQNDENYREAQDIFVDCVLNHIANNTDKLSLENLVDTVSNIRNHAPIRTNDYDDKISQLIETYATKHNYHDEKEETFLSSMEDAILLKEKIDDKVLYIPELSYTIGIKKLDDDFEIKAGNLFASYKDDFPTSEKKVFTVIDESSSQFLDEASTLSIKFDNGLYDLNYKQAFLQNEKFQITVDKTNSSIIVINKPATNQTMTFNLAEIEREKQKEYKEKINYLENFDKLYSEGKNPFNNGQKHIIEESLLTQ